MPNWSGGILTTKGQALQAKVDAGQTTLTITKMKIGSGVLASGQNLQSLNDLVAPEMNVPISAVLAEGNISTIIGVITNAGVTNGFNVRELGIYAQDPTLGEILYAITTDSAPDYLPPEGGAVTVSSEFSYNIVVSNTANVTATINPNGLITATILNQKISEHNIDQNAHNEAIAKHNSSLTAHASLLRLWQPSKTFVVGDTFRPLSLSYPSWIFLECIQGGISGALEPAWPVVGQEITDGTARWRVRDIKNGSGVTIGTITPRLALTPGPGELACDTGALVSRATYHELWTWVQSNAPLITEAAWQTQAAVQSSVGYYSSGDGSTTFRLPRLVDFVSGTDVGRPAGTWRPDDYKSHTHNAPTLIGYVSNTSNGPMYMVGTGSTLPIQPSGGAETRSKSISMLFCVKAFDAPTNQGMIDITELANEVAGKQSTLQTAIINETQASGIAGGTFTSGGWRTRTLNNIVIDQIGVTLSGNRFTLPAGTYEICASAPARGVSTHKTRLQNITDATTADIGTSEYTALSTAYATTRSFLNTIITIASSKIFEIQHYSTSTSNTDGFGNATAIASVSEIYTMVNIRKVS